ncbi:MAG: type II secretion system secretin GspD [Alphaproteobacteria bacterium]|nr:type II secretion system secretin GspD [Alphaproteobacteria bacterium]
MHTHRHAFLIALLVSATGLSGVAAAQEGPTPQPPPTDVARPGETPPATVPPEASRAEGLDLNFVDADLYSLVQYFAFQTKKNFVLADTRELSSKKVTIISHKKVTLAAAYEAFLSALEVHGLTVVQVGNTYKIIKANTAQQSPGRPGRGGNIPSTDQYITQIIPFENIGVSDVREIVDNLVSPNAKVLAYAPSNTLILTDTGYNIRRIYDIVSELDIAAPKSSLIIYPIKFADAEEIKSLIEELYGTAEDTSDTSARDRRNSRSRRTTSRTPTPEVQQGVTAGKETNYISKVLSDERTNSLIALANEQGHTVIQDLINKIDINVEPGGDIYVYRLEHAKAEDVANVLRDLAQEASSNRRSQRQGNQSAVDARVAAARAQAQAAGAGDEEVGGAIAAFESGLRISPDENTNSLVIIATTEADYKIIEGVIKELDRKRKQVFVDAVILEMSSSDTFDFNIAYHVPLQPGNDAAGVIGSQLGTNSLGFSTDLLTGLGFGVFGKTIDVPVVDTTSGTVTTLGIPSFGIALQALKTNQMVNIVSTPSLMALDNEDAKISVGRKIPFPTSSGLNSLGQPVISFQREDVAITLEITPRINSENYVTLELKVEVQEIEQSETSSASVVSQGGFITSNRELETVALVGDNQTMVLGGLVSSTETEGESKIPVLGDIPLLGALFRSKSRNARQTNLMIFLTPHIIDDPEDMEQIMRVKEAQRQEFMRRFFGKSQDEQFAEIRRLLQYSMNEVERPSVYRGPTTISSTVTLDGEPISAASREDLTNELERGRRGAPGQASDILPDDAVEVDTRPDDTPATDTAEPDTSAPGTPAPAGSTVPPAGDAGTSPDGSGLE